MDGLAHVPGRGVHMTKIYALGGVSGELGHYNSSLGRFILWGKEQGGNDTVKISGSRRRL